MEEMTVIGQKMVWRKNPAQESKNFKRDRRTL
jgi:hypothetical protein